MSLIGGTSAVCPVYAHESRKFLSANRDHFPERHQPFTLHDGCDESCCGSPVERKGTYSGIVPFRWTWPQVQLRCQRVHCEMRTRLFYRLLLKWHWLWHGRKGSCLGQSMWDLWRTKCHKDGLLSAFALSRKARISFAMSVRLSAGISASLLPAT